MKFKKPLELSYEKDGNEYLIYIFQGGAGRYKFKTIKAVTVALRYSNQDDDEMVEFWSRGESICSCLDEFDINTGIVKAVGRCISDHDSREDWDDNGFDTLEELSTYYAIKTAKRIDRRNKKRNTESEYVKMTFDDFKKFADSRVTFADIQDKVTFI